MNKNERQKNIVKKIAMSPWTYTAENLSKTLNTSIKSIYRDLKELGDNHYLFLKDEQNQLYLKDSGWDGLTSIKDSTIRQLDILRFMYSYPKGVSQADILRRFTGDKDISEKTIERDLKELETKQLIVSNQEIYYLQANQLLPPLQLDAGERSLLLGTLTLQQEISARKDEAQSILAKLKVSMSVPVANRETVVVHGRRPTDNLKRNHICQRLEKCARNRTQLTLLYRREEGPAKEIQINPLGILYYWVLDNWYLVAEECSTEKIKTYLMDRILFIEETGISFAHPEGFNLQEWFRYSWGVYRTGKPIKVVIHFYDYYSTIGRVKDELKERGSCVLREEGDCLIMEDLVDGLEDIAVWLRRFGPGAEVLEPLELRQIVKADLNKMQEIYGG